jgi:hypothetical protein
MKANIDVLTEEDIEGIKWWLELSSLGIIKREDNCPFGEPWLAHSSNKFLICNALFPTHSFDCCHKHPCDVYSLKYVTKQARYFVKEWEKKHAR